MSDTSREWRASHRQQILTMTLIIAVTVAIDQAAKWYAIHYLQGAGRFSYLGDIFRVEYAENPGAFLSLFAGLPDAARFWILTVINGAVLVGLLIYLTAKRHTDRWSYIALTLVLAGGFGNLIDRIWLGRVIDYWNLGLGSLRTGIFNIADMAISAGFLMMLPLVFQKETPPASADTSSTNTLSEPAQSS